MHGLDLWRNRWMAAGVQVIPLKAHSKEPVFSWSTIAPDEQWREAGGSAFRGNIGAVLGQGVAVIDCDDRQAVSAVSAWLTGSGIQSPTVKTISDGRHYWLRVQGAPSDFSYGRLSPEIGAGELRVSRCYVAVPCSAIGQKRYKFISGSPEAIPATKAIRWQDLLELVQPGAPQIAFERLPVRLVRREIPARASLLLEMLRDAPAGQKLDKYQSRSEAEAAVMAILILAGWQQGEILDLFESASPAHYSEAGRQSRRYFDTTWRNVLNNICNTPERLTLGDMYRQAELMAWPGRAGALNKATYKALVSVAWQFATFEPEASERVLAEHATSTRQGIHNAIRRLERLALIDIVGSSKGAYHATKYQIYQLDDSRIVANSHRFNSESALPKGAIRAKSMYHQLVDVRDFGLRWDQVEIFGAGGLGRSPGLVYGHLNSEPKTINALASATAKSWHTIKKALERLEQHQLARLSDEGWILGDGDLAAVAREYNARTRANQRRYRHERERERWLEGCEVER